MAAAKVDDIARAALAAVGIPSVNHALCAQWVNERYQEITTDARLSSFRRVARSVIPARIDAGTVTATEGSPIVTGNAAATAVWTVDLTDGHFFRVAGNNSSAEIWYEIIAQDMGAGTITLDNEYISPTSTAAGYHIIKRFNRFPSDLRHLDNITFPRLRQNIDRKTQTELARSYPGRPLAATWPVQLATAPPAADGTKRYEPYPYPENAEIIEFLYWADAPNLGLEDRVPPEIELWALKEGTIIDVLRYAAAEEARKGNEAGAGFFGNWMSRQTTHWHNTVKPMALKADIEEDATTVVMERLNSPLVSDISNAEEHVWFSDQT